MIVLLPPSETKRPGGDGPPLQLGALSTPELTPLRSALIGELVALAADPDASRKALAISASQDSEILRNAELLSAPTMPAIERYTGVLYDALDVGSLRGTTAERARSRLAVGSALFGLLRADDQIPAYRLSASSKLPAGGTLASRWKPALEPVLAHLQQQELIVDLRSGSYEALGKIPGAVTVDVYTEHPDGRRTVVTIQPDYRGPAEDFALVLPVAGEVRAEDVKTLDKRLLERVDRFSAPRLLEVWEQDPCAARPRPPTASAGRCEAATNDPRRPEPVQTFQDGEYSFMAPGPAESATIVAFLRARDYQVSDAAEAALLPHMAAGARFLIAEVDRRQVHFSADGEAVLSPLRFHYDGDRLALPLQIGTVNASGPQELVIHVLAARRHEPANAPSAIVPTAIDLRVAARERFGPVYRRRAGARGVGVAPRAPHLPKDRRPGNTGTSRLQS